MHTDKLTHLKALINFSVSSRTTEADDNPDESENKWKRSIPTIGTTELEVELEIMKRCYLFHQRKGRSVPLIPWMISSFLSRKRSNDECAEVIFLSIFCQTKKMNPSHHHLFLSLKIFAAVVVSRLCKM